MQTKGKYGGVVGVEVLTSEYYMQLALQMAEAASGQTGINPMVGCVVVKNGRMIGLGTHLQMGSPHAEVHAMKMAGDEAEGSTVYVTLEPCNYFGRTPPCSDLIINGKVAKVVIACRDPNPKVAGTGIAKLIAHGIEVEVGVLEQQARQLNEKFNKYIVSRLPFVTLKTASTLDGKIASKTGDSQWITNEQSRAIVHMLRHQHQAVMVGIETVLADDPKLNTRLPVPALDPIPIIVDSTLRIPLDAQLLSISSKVFLLTTEAASDAKKAALQQKGAVIITAGKGPRVDLKLAMQLLGDQEIGSILLEGGGRLNGSMLELGLVDKCHLFFAPKIIGGIGAPSNFTWDGLERMSDAIGFDQVSIQQYGSDFCFTGYPRYERGNA